MKFRRWLVPYLQAEDRNLPRYADRANIKFGYALTDLNDDGINEALVYVAGGMCGTGSGAFLDDVPPMGGKRTSHGIAFVRCRYAPVPACCSRASLRRPSHRHIP
jgi:hypothetical protein